MKICPPSKPHSPEMNEAEGTAVPVAAEVERRQPRSNTGCEAVDSGREMGDSLPVYVASTAESREERPDPQRKDRISEAANKATATSSQQGTKDRCQEESVTSEGAGLTRGLPLKGPWFAPNDGRIALSASPDLKAVAVLLQKTWRQLERRGAGAWRFPAAALNSCGRTSLTPPSMELRMALRIVSITQCSNST